MLKIKTSDIRLLPIRSHTYDAGLDLRSAITVNLPANMKRPEFIPSGISVKIEPGFVGLVFNRSSFAKLNIQLANSVGVIDATYRGIISVPLINRSDTPYLVNEYDRIAQLVIVPCSLTDFEVWEGSEEEWNDTARGNNGFGSTGV